MISAGTSSRFVAIRRIPSDGGPVLPPGRLPRGALGVVRTCTSRTEWSGDFEAGLATPSPTTSSLRTPAAIASAAWHRGHTVTLAGWVNTNRDHHGVIFIDDRGMQTLLKEVPNDKLVIALTGDSGTIDLNTKNVQVKGNVQAVYNDTYRFYSDEIAWNAQRKLIRSPGKVRITGPEGEIDGAQLNPDPEAKRRSQETIETCATYWHTIDLFWVLIFAMLYIVR